MTIPIKVLGALAALALLGASAAAAQPKKAAPPADTRDALAERLNANTVSIVSGTPGATYFRIASDVAFVLDDGDNLRILPILGKGAMQNAYDILLLKGVDLGLVRTDTLDLIRQDPRFRNVDRQLVYVARLFNDEMHVLTTRDVTDIRQLAGKRVNFDVTGTGAAVSGPAIFELLGIKVEALNLDQPAALDMLGRGEIAAVVSIAAKPVAVIAGLGPDSGLHILGIPDDDRLGEKYFPTTLTSDDYPNLIPKGATVQTQAVGTVLAAFNWPENTERYRRVARFVEVFFSKFDEFLKPHRHPKWREVNLAATVPGWKRFKAAQDWLDRGSGGRPAGTSRAEAGR